MIYENNSIIICNNCQIKWKYKEKRSSDKQPICPCCHQVKYIEVVKK